MFQHAFVSSRARGGRLGSSEVVQVPWEGRAGRCQVQRGTSWAPAQIQIPSLALVSPDAGQSSVPRVSPELICVQEYLGPVPTLAQQVIKSDELIPIVVLETRFSPGQLMSWLRLIKAFSVFPS